MVMVEIVVVDNIVVMAEIVVVNDIVVVDRIEVGVVEVIDI